MKKALLIYLFAICLAFPISAQEETQKITLPDSVMEQVVKRIVIWNFKPRIKPTDIRISNRNVKSEWLPTVRNIQFVLVDDDSNTVGLHFFKAVEKEGRGFLIGFGYGDPNCSSIGKLWYFRVVNGRVRLKTGVGNFGSFCSSHG